MAYLAQLLRPSATGSISLLGLLLLAGCAAPDAPETPARTAAAEAPPTPVEIRSDAEGYQLYVDGEPFFIEGAGLEFGSVERLAARGGNSFRTWRTDNGRLTGREVLDRAHANGLYVTMGLEIAREREGQGRGGRCRRSFVCHAIHKLCG